ncbi:MAG: hypothetical protein KA180_03765 [Gemmatimonadales bacterium]|nr:hypothetical protein [Gemmatimonadales bacterium]
MLWLVVFLGVAVAVNARQAAGVELAGEYGRLRERRTALEAEHAALQREIRLATSRRVLGERAAAELGLHQPGNGEFVVLRLGRAPR